MDRLIFMQMECREGPARGKRDLFCLSQDQNLGGGCPLDFLPDEISESGKAYARTPSSLWKLNEIPDALLFHEHVNMAYGFVSEWHDMSNCSKYSGGSSSSTEQYLATWQK